MITQDYCWVGATACVIGFQCVMEGFFAGGQRRKHFSSEFFKKNFPKLENPPRGGYPDMGNGKFAEKLTLEEWTEFNNVQRAHYNYVEGVATAITFVLINGLFQPRLTVGCGILYIAGRAVYGIGYRSVGPKARLPGALMVDLALVVMFGSVLYNTISSGGGFTGFKNLMLGSS